VYFAHENDILVHEFVILTTLIGNFIARKPHFMWIKGKDKGKAIPLQAWRGPAGSRRLRLPDFKIIGT
jgi:hypothetical protein